MERFKTNELYVVKPSIVLYDDTKTIEKIKTKMVKHLELEKIVDIKISYLHHVDFEFDPKNINIAHERFGQISLETIFDNKIIYEIIPNHCVEGEMYVNVFKDDMILLSKYLYELNDLNPKWPRELNEYLVSLKPYYEIEELKEILDKIKEIDTDVNEPKIKTYEKKYKI